MFMDYVKLHKIAIDETLMIPSRNWDTGALGS